MIWSIGEPGSAAVVDGTCDGDPPVEGGATDEVTGGTVIPIVLGDAVAPGSAASQADRAAVSATPATTRPTRISSSVCT